MGLKVNILFQTRTNLTISDLYIYAWVYYDVKDLI